ncbi:MAG: septal ring lytic transglycosylase RlpA family protein [Deferribacterota bacterium]|nr:septal ring lytic transglycosylase RlpA family protein [Deferribacterota bacterium]
MYFFAFYIVSCANSAQGDSYYGRYYSSNTKYSRVSYGKPYVIRGVTYYPLASVDKYTETGIASWYGSEEHGQLTASGEVYDMYKMTAAHKTLPLGSYVSVDNLENGKKVVVRINDRGPFVRGRIIDLSYSAAKKIGIVDKGLARVRVTLLSENPNYYMVRGKKLDIDKGSFAIQIGSFNSYSNATNLANRLDNTKIKSVDINGKIFYRVYICGFKDREKAEDFLRDIQGVYPDAFVIAEK